MRAAYESLYFGRVLWLQAGFVFKQGLSLQFWIAAHFAIVLTD